MTLAIILGLIVGSFLNAVVYRLHKGISFVSGRSFCPHCKHELHTRDLVPLFSYLFLGGKCRYCNKKISWQYPLVELGTAIVFALLMWQFGLSSIFVVYAIFAIFLIIMFVYDLKYYLILDKVSIPAAIIALILSLFVLKIAPLDLLWGALIGGGFFFLQFIVSKGKWIGGGDIRLGVVMGLMLGYQMVLVALFAAYVLGSLVGVALIVFGNKKWKSQVPFGTFLSAATLFAILWGEPVLWHYKQFLLL